MTRAEMTRRLLDAGFSPIEAHRAVANGEADSLLEQSQEQNGELTDMDVLTR